VAEKEEKRVVHIISESGRPMMTLEALGREGDRMVIQGQMVGAWPCKMYINLEDVLRMVRLLLAPQVIFYILSLPFLVLFRTWRRTKRQ